MNKKIVILLLTLVHWSATQAQFTDNFSDGDFLLNPTWFGDDNKYLIENEQLKLLALAESASAYLATESTSIVNGSWEFYAKLEFNPSSSNLARVYLIADQQNLSGDLNGYYVQLGGTDDEVSLYRQTGSTRTKIIDGVNGRLNLSVSESKIRVTRDENGKWQLFSDVGLTNTFSSEGEVGDLTHTSSDYFGVYCLYTATRSDKFYFDEFIVTGTLFTPPTASLWKDVILTEIYADPSSSKGLPNAEFTELYNRTDKPINLNGWRFSDPNSGGVLTGVILPGEYLTLTSTSAQIDFEAFGKAIGVSSFPSLNNAGDVLLLKDNNGNLIDSVNYSDAWYKDVTKKSGGWSMELIDPENPCGESDNWIASNAAVGGTPGKQNSVFANKPDLTPPKLLSVIAQSSTELLLKFNEKLKAEIPVLTNFLITPNTEIIAINFEEAALTKLVLKLNTALISETDYTLTVVGIRDCNGNMMEAESFIFGLPEVATAMDIVINEILFNPRPTGVDFVELYNPTTKYFNLKNWSLANRAGDLVANAKTITKDDLILAPKEYRVITSDAETILSHYPLAIERNIFQSQLPSLPDDEGSIVLVNNDQHVIDEFQYSDDLHSVFIKDDDGVSLERIAANRPTMDGANWKSASATAGFATPGYLNSNSLAGPTTSQDDVTVQPELFIPIYGQPDFTEIRYKFDQGGWVANIKIFSTRGVLIKVVANNITLGTEGFFRWDGDQEDGSKARIGYYLVWFQVFDSGGQVKTFRKRVVIGTEF